MLRMIWLVLLAYNEQAGIGRQLSNIRDLHLADLRIIVVDDGSMDGTAAILRDLAPTMPLEILSHKINRGIAASFNTGLRHASASSAPSDVIITMEADGTSDPAALPSIIELLRAGSDVVCASRYLPSGGYTGFPLHRRMISAGANLITRWYVRLHPIKDYTFFYRGYRAGLLHEAFRRYGDRFIEAHGFFSNVEILIKLSRLRPLRVAETPVVYPYGMKRSRSTMRIWRNLLEYLRFFLRDMRHPVRPDP